MSVSTSQHTAGLARRSVNRHLMLRSKAPLSTEQRVLSCVLICKLIKLRSFKGNLLWRHSAVFVFIFCTMSWSRKLTRLSGPLKLWHIKRPLFHQNVEGYWCTMDRQAHWSWLESGDNEGKNYNDHGKMWPRQGNIMQHFTAGIYMLECIPMQHLTIFRAFIFFFFYLD